MWHKVSPDKGPPCTNLTGKEAMKDNLAERRELVLREIVKEMKPNKYYNSIPNCVKNIFPSLRWNNQTKNGTKKVLHLLRKMMTKAKEHKLVAQRTYLVIQHGMPGSLASCGNS